MVSQAQAKEMDKIEVKLDPDKVKGQAQVLVKVELVQDKILVKLDQEPILVKKVDQVKEVDQTLVKVDQLQDQTPVKQVKGKGKTWVKLV